MWKGEKRLSHVRTTHLTIKISKIFRVKIACNNRSEWFYSFLLLLKWQTQHNKLRSLKFVHITHCRIRAYFPYLCFFLQPRIGCFVSNYNRRRRRRCRLQQYVFLSSQEARAPLNEHVSSSGSIKTSTTQKSTEQSAQWLNWNCEQRPTAHRTNVFVFCHFYFLQQ